MRYRGGPSSVATPGAAAPPLAMASKSRHRHGYRLPDTGRGHYLCVARPDRSRNRRLAAPPTARQPGCHRRARCGWYRLPVARRGPRSGQNPVRLGTMQTADYPPDARAPARRLSHGSAAPSLPPPVFFVAAALLHRQYRPPLTGFVDQLAVGAPDRPATRPRRSVDGLLRNAAMPNSQSCRRTPRCASGGS